VPSKKGFDFGGVGFKWGCLGVARVDVWLNISHNSFTGGDSVFGVKKYILPKKINHRFYPMISPILTPRNRQILKFASLLTIIC
jgi:hypothetical protein